MRAAAQVPEARLEDGLLKALREFYLSTAVSRLAQAWNALREATLREAVVGRLLPALATELRARLAANAREAALHAAQDALWAWARRAPLQARAAPPLPQPPCLLYWISPTWPLTLSPMPSLTGNFLTGEPLSYIRGVG
jgi:hypothetical protein